MNLKLVLRKIFPERLILFYHFCLAYLAAIYYNFPSEKMIIIGVTGTKGKTSTTNFIWSCLEAGGYKTGILSTANIRIGNKEILNKYHMTMPGPFILQRYFAKMKKEGCNFCVVETTSEGIKQFRHLGINYDILVFTNLFPEHLPSHGGSFEKYKETKGKLFERLARQKRKVIEGKKIEKVIIANIDAPEADYFLNFEADKKITFGFKKNADFVIEGVKSLSHNGGVQFLVNKKPFQLSVIGTFNTKNSLPAIIIASLFSLSDEVINKGLKNLKLIPGRMETIDEGQDFFVFVDYAHERESMKNALTTARETAKENKVIVLLGAEGGGRDKRKRSLMGEIAGKMADFVILSNVDPYDDDPKEIIEEIAKAVEKEGKVRNKNLFLIEDRREGIAKSLFLAKKGDVVLITGKGAEQSMIIKGKQYAWDDRRVVREELKILNKKRYED